MFIKMPDTLQFRPLLQETNGTNDLFQSEPSRPCCRITALPPRPINRFFVVAFRRLPLYLRDTYSRYTRRSKSEHAASF